MHRRPTQMALTVVAYALTTFGVQGASHFAINADHFASLSIMRAEPLIPLGITSMLIQGLIFAWLYPVYANGASTLRKSIVFSWLLGGFLASYIVLVEAGKYAIPSLSRWIAVAARGAFVQYRFFRS